MREETHCHHMGFSFRLAARVLLYASSYRQDNTYHSLCYTSSGALAGTRNSSMGPPDEGSIRRPVAPWANALTTELHLAPIVCQWIQQTIHRTAKRPFVWLISKPLSFLSCNHATAAEIIILNACVQADPPEQPVLVCFVFVSQLVK